MGPGVDNVDMDDLKYYVERGAPGLVMGPCIVEIDLIVIREVHNQFEVNLKGNIGWVWPMWANMDDVQYKFEFNWRINEEVMLKLFFGWAWSMWARRPRLDVQYHFEVNRYSNEEVNFQGFSANSVGEDSGQDGHTAEITTISPRF
ncbi:hypothetical protein DPMN_023317 [Dreissena polymorpha]|uniref:Uncharacterized protein n=1 Tax=Dreissena polymorpha TaxID=45954 RepID=A0A9D4RB99_DREPO|nr:hypothetical protein DPMN_023317 [Dreissena polymorpha]